MSKDSVVDPLKSAAGVIGGIGSSLLSVVKPPSPPKIPDPVAAPTRADDAVVQAQQAVLEESSKTVSRRATLLTGARGATDRSATRSSILGG